MMPLHSKLFSMVDAQAGAPISCVDGASATVFKWDCRRAVYKLAGIRGDVDESAVWTQEGQHQSCYGGAALVMLPLGMIDGKPVFVGDEYMFEGMKYTAIPSGFDGFDGCSWPTPAKVYPKTLMSAELLESYCHGSGGSTASLFRIANAAICHAIDAGQVVIAVDPGQVFIAEVKK